MGKLRLREVKELIGFPSPGRDRGRTGGAGLEYWRLLCRSRRVEACLHSFLTLWLGDSKDLLTLRCYLAFSIRAPGWGRLTGSQASTLFLQLSRVKNNLQLPEICAQGRKDMGYPSRLSLFSSRVKSVAASLSSSPCPPSPPSLLLSPLIQNSWENLYWNPSFS